MAKNTGRRRGRPSRRLRFAQAPQDEDCKWRGLAPPVPVSFPPNHAARSARAGRNGMRARAFPTIIAVLALGATSALAQTYPTHPVSIVVGYPPGATSDLLARTVGDPLSTALGQPVVIDNRAG